MAIDGTNTLFYSGWNIDQLFRSAEVTLAVTASNTQVVDFTDLNLTFPPKFIVAAKQAGSSVWEQSGNRLRASITSNKLYVNSQVFPATNWTIRYYILNTASNA